MYFLVRSMENERNMVDTLSIASSNGTRDLDLTTSIDMSIVTKIAEIGFIGVTGVNIQGQAVSQYPIRITNPKLVVFKNVRKHVEISAHATIDPLFINILDENERVKSVFVISKDEFCLNERFVVSSSGTVRYNVRNDQMPAKRPNTLDVQVNVGDNGFKVILYKFGRFEFDVYSNGAVFVDPFSENLSN